MSKNKGLKRVNGSSGHAADFPSLTEARSASHLLSSIQQPKPVAAPQAAPQAHQPGNREGTRNANSRPAKTKPSSLDEFIDNYVKNIFKQKSYLETASMVAHLVEQGVPERELFWNEKVKNLLRLNKGINLMIDVYERTNSIMVYCELKDFIVNQMKAYLKSLNISCFEDLAIGYLFAHPKIFTIFGFPVGSKESDYTSNPVTKEMIFNIAKDFLVPHSKVDLKNDGDRVQTDFTAFMRHKLKVEFGISQGEGVVVIFKDIFHHLIKLKSLESRELVQMREKSAKEFRERADESLKVLLGSLQIKKGKDRMKVVTEDLLGGKQKTRFNDAQEYVRGLLLKGTEEGLEDELMCLLSGMTVDCCILRDNKKQRALVFQVDPNEDGNAENLWNALQVVEKVKGVELCVSAPPHKQLNHLLVNFVALLCWLVLDNSEECWGYVEAGFDSHSLEVKIFVRSCVQDLLSHVIPKPAIYVDENGRNVKSTVSFADTLDRLREVVLTTISARIGTGSFLELVSGLNGETLKKAVQEAQASAAISVECVSGRNLVALLAGSVIVRRITANKAVVESVIAAKREYLKKCVPVVVKSAVKESEWLREALEGSTASANKKGASSTTSATTLKPTAIVTRLLKELEYKLLVASDIPTFEALRMKSYLHAVLELEIEQTIDSILSEVYPEWNRKFTSDSGNAGGSQAEEEELSLTMAELCSLLDQAFTELPAASTNSALVPAEVMHHLERSVLKQCGVASFEQLTGGKSFLSFVQSALYDEEVAADSVALKFLQSAAGSNAATAIASADVDEVKGDVEDGEHVASVLPAIAAPSVSLSRAVVTLAVEQWMHFHLPRLQSSKTGADSVNEDRLDLIVMIIGAICSQFQIQSSFVLHKMVAESVDEFRQANTMFAKDLLAKKVEESPLLVFSSITTTDVASSVMACDLTSQAIEMLLQVPIGLDCNTFTQWSDVFAIRVSADGTRMSVVDFITQHAALFSERLGDVVFFCTDGGQNCVPVLRSAPTREQFAAAWEGRDIPRIAGLMCGAVVCRHNNAGVNCIRHLFESLVDINSAIDLCVQVVRNLPSSAALTRSVLLLLGEVISQMQHITVEGAVKIIANQAAEIGDVLCVAKLNAVATLFPTEFEPVRCRAKAFLDTSGVVKSTDDVFDEKTTAAVADGVDHSAKTDSEQQSSPTTNGSLVQPSNEACADKKVMIQEFLRTDFGYDSEGHRPPKDGAQSINLQKALDLLSASLYTSDVHFVMELLQNADDNTYAPGVKPALKFELHRDALYLFNNEMGFQPADIYSICKVGGSTKTVRAGVHIGQKGIGFKSVFSISDCPEVHSNGFHIRFDKSVSMLEPIWISESGHYRWPKHMQKFGDDDIDTYFETCLRLQFDSKTRSEFAVQKAKLQEVLDERLLLFLNKIEILEMVDHSVSIVSRSALSKREIAHDWIYVTHQKFDATFSDSYWLVKRQPFTPQSRRNDQIVEKTEVALAFMFNGSLMDLESTKGSSKKSSAATASDNEEEMTSQRRELTLDTADAMMKMYAFLPTSYGYFRFIIQGDFVLATNRESILENSWNQELLDQVPQMVVEMLEEFALWAWKSAKDSTTSADTAVFPNLSKLPETSYKVSMTIQDVFHLLPRLSTIRKDERRIIELIHAIYIKLRDVKFLLSQSGQLCNASDLLYVDHLAFKPSKYISEDELLASIGKRYLHSDVEYDAELFELLGIEVFSETHVLACLKKFAADLEITAATSGSEMTEDPSVHGQRMAKLSRYLLVLTKLTGEESAVSQSTTFGSGKSVKKSTNRLEPSQVSLQKLRLHGVSNGKTTSMKAVQSELFKTLRALKIWPVVENKERRFVSLQSDTVLVYSTNQLPDVQHCVEVFKHQLLLLDELLLNESHKIEGRPVLQGFLVQKFSCSHNTGGIENLSVDTIVRSFIINRYESVTEGSQWSFDRHTSAAMLAFLFLSSVKKNCRAPHDPAFQSNLSALNLILKKANIIIPTLSVRNKDKHKIVWSASTTRVINRQTSTNAVIPDDEVHLGVEFPKSASSSFASMAMSTALRQMNWTIVDPLVAAFVVGVQSCPDFKLTTSATKDDGSGGYLLHEPLSIVFKNSRFREVELMWRTFLLHIGVVDFFGVYKQEAPSLFKFLSHYLARAKPAIKIGSGIGGNSWSSNELKTINTVVDSDAVENDTEDAIDDLDTTDLLLYVPQSDSAVVDAPLLVSLNTHEILNRIANMIVNELSAMKTADKSKLLSDLSRRSWLPANLNRPTIRLPTGFALVAAPLTVFHCTQLVHREVLEWFPMGQHVMYKANGVTFDDQANPLKLKYYINGQFDWDEVMKLFIWMTEQPVGSVFQSSLPWMHSVYATMFSEYLTGSKVQSEISQRILNTLYQERPFLWFPDEVVNAESYIDTSAKPGKLYPLKDVFERDYTTSLNFLKTSSPHRSLMDSYNLLTEKRDNPPLSAYFCRGRCCPVCNAVEGMFGVRGQIVGSPHGRNQKCTCTEAPLAVLTSADVGLVRKSASLQHTLNLIVQQRDEYLRLVDLAAPKEARQSLLDVILLTLENISREVWKCFHIDNCLHAYSKATLTMLKERSQTMKLLPSLDNLQFFCLKTEGVKSIKDVGVEDSGSDADSESDDEDVDIILTIAVDDLQVFECFKTKLDQLPSIQWVDGRVTQTDFFPAVSLDVSKSRETLYDLDRFGDSCTKFLNAPNFRQLAATIPPMTFYAPMDLLTLYGFLGIDSLSKFVTTTWNVVKAVDATKELSGQSVVGSSVLDLINNLLLIVQTVLTNKVDEITGYIPQLFVKTERMTKLLNVTVVDCSSLSRSVELKLEGLSEVAELKQDYHYDAAENILFVSVGISKANKIKLCSDFVLSAIRLELSLCNMNQNLEILSKCKELFTKLSEKSTDSILNYLDTDFIIPNDADRWRIVKPVIVAAAEVDEKQSGESDDEDDEATRKALQNLNSMGKSKPAVVVASTSSKPKDANLKAFLAEKEMKDRMGAIVSSLESQMQPEQVVPTVEVQVNDGIIKSTQNQRPFNVGSGSASGAASVSGGSVRSSVNSVAGAGSSSVRGQLPVSGPPAIPFDATSGSGSDNNSSNDYVSAVEVDRRYENAFNTSVADVVIPSGAPMSAEYEQHLRLNAALDGNASGSSGIGMLPNFNQDSRLMAQMTDGAFMGVPFVVPPMHQQQLLPPSELVPLNAVNQMMFGPRVGSSDLNVNVKISDVILQNFVNVSQMPDTQLQDYIRSDNGHALTGRLGEMIAYKHLQEKLAGEVVSINWMNETVELGMPFDIEIMLIDGRKKRCEVKTRLSAGVVNQWHISPNEVRCMQGDPENYFAILFSLAVTPDLSRIKVHSCMEVGFEEGLWRVVESGSAGFIIQVHNGVV